MHPIFRFSRTRAKTDAIWQKTGADVLVVRQYRLKPLAEVLAVHPASRPTGRAARTGLRTAAAGRAAIRRHRPQHVLRLRRDLALALPRGRVALQQVLDPDDALPVARPTTRTDLRLDRQTPYRWASRSRSRCASRTATPGGKEGPKLNDKTPVKVSVEYFPNDRTARRSRNSEPSSSPRWKEAGAPTRGNGPAAARASIASA